MKTSKTKRGKQRQFKASEKVAIIRRHLIEKVTVSDLCDEYKISPSVYYRWQAQFFEGGEKAFAASSESRQVSELKDEVSQLEEKLARKDEVLGEVMEEYVSLKKRAGGR